MKKKLQREIKQIEQKKQEELNKLYALGLAPYYGYYEDILKTQIAKTQIS